MGMNVSTKLIVGVPLLELGILTRKEKEIDLTNAVGIPTGKTAILKEVYFVISDHPDFSNNPLHCLIASNSKSISEHGDRYATISYQYNLLVSDSFWIHTSTHSATPDQVIVGLSIQNISGPELDRFETFSAARVLCVQELIKEVKEFMQSRFGYDGDIYIVSQAHYSY